MGGDLPVKFPLPLADASHYPTPSIWGYAQKPTWRVPGSDKLCFSEFFKQGFYSKNGRSALGIVAKLLGLTKNDSIILPEYFCPAMVEPFIWLGIKVKFYRLNKDLTINRAHFESLICVDVKACLLVSFFGFPIDIENSLLLAKKHGLLVIEDCAHSFFSAKASRPDVQFDASICSLHKFFPCSDGGMYCVDNRYLSTDLLGNGAINYIDELKNLLNVLGFGKILGQAGKLLRKKQSVPVVSGEGNRNSDYRYFKPRDVQRSCYKLSQWIVRASDLSLITQARVHNYKLLYQGLKDSAVGVPLFEPENEVIPYVFPFLLRNGEDFDYIRQKGIQIMRWEEFYPTNNSEIEGFRKTLIQIPCHQDLSHKQIQTIIAIINKQSCKQG
jgi:dTDP-4-amino-4,6-dideoxygalactose transaminase